MNPIIKDAILTKYRIEIKYHLMPEMQSIFNSIHNHKVF